MTYKTKIKNFVSSTKPKMDSASSLIQRMIEAGIFNALEVTPKYFDMCNFIHNEYQIPVSIGGFKCSHRGN